MCGNRGAPDCVTSTLVFILVLLFTVLLVFFLAGSEARADVGMQDTPRIEQLIYPTLGNPAIVNCGNDLTIEWDPRALSGGPEPPEITSFEVTVTSTNDACPVTRKLTVTSFEKDYSKVWPNLDDKVIYRVTVNVPHNVPLDLYDMTVKALTDGAWVTDSEPHALQTVDRFKDPFSFCHLTDINVFGPECNYISSAMQERNYRHEDYRPGDDGYGAKYYHKAIQQINRMKPDFCVYTGDYMFGQQWLTKDYGDFGPYARTVWDRTMTEHEFEMDWFYQETLALDVPVFIGMGNHDGYKDNHEDWFTNWKKMFGPLYFSFDYGDCHFTMLNSMDWPLDLRKLTSWSGIILQPTKYKGQLRGGGDAWGATGAPPEDQYTGQLAWMRDDLKASQDAKMRVAAMHHDPWKDNDSGSVWASGEGGWIEAITGAIDMGNGEGRRAAIQLMRDYKVSLVVSGNDHSDYVGDVGYSSADRESAGSVQTVPWTVNGSPDPLETGAQGEVKFVNTTSTQFQKDGDTNVYPGYRRVWINNGQVESYNYHEPKYSYPWYKDTNIEGNTDLTNLSTPTIESSFAPESGDALDVTCMITNHLEKSLPSAYAEFPMPYLSGGYYYEVDNGSFGDVYDNDSGTMRICQVYTNVAAGSTKAPRVFKSASADKKSPTGSMKINNGAAKTTTRKVTLNIDASDTGGSGLKDMMISNSPDFDGAKWERYVSTRKWTLVGGTAGWRTVYVKFRDRAMAPNNSAVASDEIMFSPSDDDGGPAYTWYFAEGCTREGFEEWLSIQNPNTGECDVDITYMTGDGENIPQSITIGPESRYTVNVNEAVGPGRDVSAKVEGSFPIIVERPMYFDYQGMWTGGHDVIGTNTPSDTWYFAEGCTREGAAANFHTWLCMQNPRDEQVTVTVTYMPEEGDNVVKEVVIPAMSRKTECANWDVGPGRDLSIMVESSNAIICERPVYFNYQGVMDGGHDVIGAVKSANDWYLAEGTTHGGFHTYVCIQNPNDSDANVTLEYMLQDGTAPDQVVVVPAKGRKTVYVNEWVGPARDVSIHVFSDNPIITERSMYFVYGSGWPGGHCVVSATTAHDSWYFAEGCTRTGFEEWLCIQNPGESVAEVTIQYLLEDGTTVSQQVAVEAMSRYTVDVNGFMMTGHDVSATLTSSVPVIVERPMYIDYHGAWKGGHCVVGSGTSQ